MEKEKGKRKGEKMGKEKRKGGEGEGEGKGERKGERKKDGTITKWDVFWDTVYNQPPSSTQSSIPPGWVDQVFAFLATNKVQHVHPCQVAGNTV